MKNFKVKCLKDLSFGAVTPGHIYSVVDGKLVDDDGDERPLGYSTFESVADVCGWGGEFELVKESKMFTKDDIRSGDKIWMKNGYGIVIHLGESLIVLYFDHRGWDYIPNMEEVQKIVRTDYGGNLLTGNESAGKVIFDREKGIGCEPPAKEISVDEAAKLLTEKFGQDVRIRVGE